MESSLQAFVDHRMVNDDYGDALTFREFVTAPVQKGTRAPVSGCAHILSGSVINQTRTGSLSSTSQGETPSITDSKASFHLRSLSLAGKLMVTVAKLEGIHPAAAS
jgi:hypothetical protein